MKPSESHVRGAHSFSQGSWDVMDIVNVILHESDLSTLSSELDHHDGTYSSLYLRQ